MHLSKKQRKFAIVVIGIATASLVLSSMASIFFYLF